MFAPSSFLAASFLPMSWAGTGVAIYTTDYRRRRFGLGLGTVVHRPTTRP